MFSDKNLKELGEVVTLEIWEIVRVQKKVERDYKKIEKKY